MTPAEAREVLAGQREYVPWITTDLWGGSRRAKRRHREREDTGRAAIRARNAELDNIAALPDTDLQWLLDQGWTP